MGPLRLDEYEELARARLAADLWDYIAGGSGDETTLAVNRAPLDRLRLRPRVLVDVSKVDISTSILGAPLAAPIGVAPVAYHRMVHPDGEVATARAAGAVGA